MRSILSSLSIVLHFVLFYFGKEQETVLEVNRQCLKPNSFVDKFAIGT